MIRANQTAMVDGTAPYADARVRRALALAVDNEICLELGYSGRGIVAANHHVCPVHPAYADIGPADFDPARARQLIEEAGLQDFEHDLVTIDDEWQRNTGDAVAALLRDAGLRVRRTIQPGSIFWQNWKKYPFSATQWNHRPLGTQVLGLAYRSNAVWNETEKRNLSYCVSRDFGARYDQVVAAMANAAGAWEAVADIDFVHDATHDSNCTAANHQVVFDVRAVTGARYLARAFFPDNARSSRNVLINDSSFNLDPNGNLTLVGILRHELGHTLGFRHEHTRPESGTCFEDSNLPVRRGPGFPDRSQHLHAARSADAAAGNLRPAGRRGIRLGRPAPGRAGG